MQQAKDVISKKAKRISSRITGNPLSQPIADVTGSLPYSITHDGMDLSVPDALQSGTEMLKVSDKKEKRVVFKLDPDAGYLSYQSSKRGIVPIEAIEEIRTGENTRYDCQRFKKPEEWMSRWLTIIYIIDGSYKTLQMVADTRDVLHQWQTSLRKLYVIRQGLMIGLDKFDLRRTIWERRYWKGADAEGDQKLDFVEVLGLCKRLNVNLSSAALQKLFHTADSRKRGYLDFQGFQCFVEALKYRPELNSIYEDIKSKHGKFDYLAFEKFVTGIQKTSLSESELESIFLKHTHSTTLTDNPVMTLDQFSSFLLSPDSAVFSEAGKGVWHDMTRPLSDYYLSSSHNTYLVGNQLVGVSTIEGYIRALLHSCRTVELDIYDGSDEPVIYHGGTLTSKVSLRDICQAINKYAFVTSAYPVIISAELHLCVRQQDKMVDIMVEEFGGRLVRVSMEGKRPQVEKLPSPEQLKHKILLKAKNRYVVAELAERKAQFERELEHFSQQQSPLHHENTFSSLRNLASSSSEQSSADDEGRNNTTGTGIRNELKDLKSKWRKFRGHGDELNTTPDIAGSIPNKSRSTSPPPSMQITLPSPPSPRDTPLTEVSTKTNTPYSSSSPDKTKDKDKTEMSPRLVSLLVYTVGVKCHGIGAHCGITYSPEHVFSLSENSINQLIKARSSSSSTTAGGHIGESSDGSAEGGRGGKGRLRELIKHAQTNLIRTYPKGFRVNSSNYEPHRYWAAGAQVAALNWQTFDLGYTINQAMFQRNGKAGYVLKPLALRAEGEELLDIYSQHFFDITIISAQQLPRSRDSSGQEIMDDSIIDPFIEVALHIPEWITSPLLSPPSTPSPPLAQQPPTHLLSSASMTSPRLPHLPPMPRTQSPSSTSAARRVSQRTKVVKSNGFNPVWQETLSIPFDCVGGIGEVGNGGMLDLVFVEISARRQGDEEGHEPVAVFCAPLSTIELGYRYLPLYDMQLKQHMFSTLFVKIGIRDRTD